MSVVFYGCGTLSLNLRKECKLRIFQNWVLRKKFGPQMEIKRKFGVRRKGLLNRYSSNTVSVMKSKGMVWA
jgi:hypothetical protein